MTTVANIETEIVTQNECIRAEPEDTNKDMNLEDNSDCKQVVHSVTPDCHLTVGTDLHLSQDQLQRNNSAAEAGLEEHDLHSTAGSDGESSTVGRSGMLCKDVAIGVSLDNGSEPCTAEDEASTKDHECISKLRDAELVQMENSVQQSVEFHSTDIVDKLKRENVNQDLFDHDMRVVSKWDSVRFDQADVSQPNVSQNRSCLQLSDAIKSDTRCINQDPSGFRPNDVDRANVADVSSELYEQHLDDVEMCDVITNDHDIKEDEDKTEHITDVVVKGYSSVNENVTNDKFNVTSLAVKESSTESKMEELSSHDTDEVSSGCLDKYSDQLVGSSYEKRLVTEYICEENQSKSSAGQTRIINEDSCQNGGVLTNGGFVNDHNFKENQDKTECITDVVVTVTGYGSVNEDVTNDKFNGTSLTLKESSTESKTEELSSHVTDEVSTGCLDKNGDQLVRSSYEERLVTECICEENQSKSSAGQTRIINEDSCQNEGVLTDGGFVNDHDIKEDEDKTECINDVVKGYSSVNEDVTDRIFNVTSLAVKESSTESKTEKSTHDLNEDFTECLDKNSSHLICSYSDQGLATEHTSEDKKSDSSTEKTRIINDASSGNEGCLTSSGSFAAMSDSSEANPACVLDESNKSENKMTVHKNLENIAPNDLSVEQASLVTDCVEVIVPPASSPHDHVSDCQLADGINLHVSNWTDMSKTAGTETIVEGQSCLISTAEGASKPGNSIRWVREDSWNVLSVNTATKPCSVGSEENTKDHDDISPVGRVQKGNCAEGSSKSRSTRVDRLLRENVKQEPFDHHTRVVNELDVNVAIHDSARLQANVGQSEENSSLEKADDSSDVSQFKAVSVNQEIQNQSDVKQNTLKAGGQANVSLLIPELDISALTDRNEEQNKSLNVGYMLANEKVSCRYDDHVNGITETEPACLDVEMTSVDVLSGSCVHEMVTTVTDEGKINEVVLKDQPLSDAESSDLCHSVVNVGSCDSEMCSKVLIKTNKRHSMKCHASRCEQSILPDFDALSSGCTTESSGKQELSSCHSSKKLTKLAPNGRQHTTRSTISKNKVEKTVETGASPSKNYSEILTKSVCVSLELLSFKDSPTSVTPSETKQRKSGLKKACSKSLKSLVAGVQSHADGSESALSKVYQPVKRQREKCSSSDITDLEYIKKRRHESLNPAFQLGSSGITSDCQIVRSKGTSSRKCLNKTSPNSVSLSKRCWKQYAKILDNPPVVLLDKLMTDQMIAAKIHRDTPLQQHSGLVMPPSEENLERKLNHPKSELSDGKPKKTDQKKSENTIQYMTSANTGHYRCQLCSVGFPQHINKHLHRRCHSRKKKTSKTYRRKIQTKKIQCSQCLEMCTSATILRKHIAAFHDKSSKEIEHSKDRQSSDVKKSYHDQLKPIQRPHHSNKQGISYQKDKAIATCKEGSADHLAVDTAETSTRNTSSSADYVSREKFHEHQDNMKEKQRKITHNWKKNLKYNATNVERENPSADIDQKGSSSQISVELHSDMVSLTQNDLKRRRVGVSPKTAVIMFQCLRCPKAFRCKSSLKRHEKRLHQPCSMVEVKNSTALKTSPGDQFGTKHCVGEDDWMVFLCKLCNRYFCRLSDFEKHQKITHTYLKQHNPYPSEEKGMHTFGGV